MIYMLISCIIQQIQLLKNIIKVKQKCVILGCFFFKNFFFIYFFREINAQSSINFTYSAFHGVGSKFAHRLLLEYGIREENIFHVKVNILFFLNFF